MSSVPLNPDFIPLDPASIPPAVAALSVRHHPDHGPLLLNRDVARLLGVGISTLRRRRARGRFPDAVLKEPTASWYRLADIAREYAQQFAQAQALAVTQPVGEIPPLFSEGGVTPGDRPHYGAVTLPLPSETDSLREMVSSGEIGENLAPLSPETQVSLAAQEMSRTQEMLRAVVRGAIAELIEYEPEDPAMLKALTETVASQQQTILSQQHDLQSQQRQIERLHQTLQRTLQEATQASEEGTQALPKLFLSEKEASAPPETETPVALVQSVGYWWNPRTWGRR